MKAAPHGSANLFHSTLQHSQWGAKKFHLSMVGSVSSRGPFLVDFFECSIDLFLELGYAAKPSLTMDQRLRLGANVEHILAQEKEAAKAPPKILWFFVQNVSKKNVLKSMRPFKRRVAPSSAFFFWLLLSSRYSWRKLQKGPCDDSSMNGNTRKPSSNLNRSSPRTIDHMDSTRLCPVPEQ